MRRNHVPKPTPCTQAFQWLYLPVCHVDVTHTHTFYTGVSGILQPNSLLLCVFK